MRSDLVGEFKSAPKVSWVLCTNKLDDLLGRAVNSCLNQSMEDFELLLIVNGPDYRNISNHLRVTYQHDSRIRVIDTPICLLNFSLSLGLHFARGDLIARMDADDVSSKNRLEIQCRYMDENPNVSMLGCFYQFIDAAGNLGRLVQVPESDQAIRSALFWRNPFCHPSVIFRRDLAISVGGYLGGRNAEDYDLWLRFAAIPLMKFANLKEPLLFYNVNPDGPARGSRAAYANVAAAQLRNGILTRNGKWFLGAFLTWIKLISRSKNV